MTRTLFVLAVALLVTVSGFTQDKKDDKKAANLYPLTKGTKWEYTLKVGGQEIEGTQEVTEVAEAKKGERAVSTISTNIGPQKITEEMSADDKGVYRHAMQGQKLETPILAVKYPVKAGTKWTEKVKVMGQEADVEFETKDGEKVKVAAGEYTATPVEMVVKAGGQTVNVTTWYAEGVGMVKQEMSLGGQKITMELKKFTAAK
ncbi:MAG: hypothetical protein MUF18_06750 [Fimbriiglobus sp.]|jgi:hypothetical protein|nr:hypothetical protein [Fimbriiglobus sp.]